MENNMQLSELREIAKERGLKNISKLKKDELIELLKNTPEEIETVKVEEKTIATEVEDVEDKEDFISGNRCIQSYWRK